MKNCKAVFNRDRNINTKPVDIGGYCITGVYLRHPSEVINITEIKLKKPGLDDLLKKAR